MQVPFYVKSALVLLSCTLFLFLLYFAQVVFVPLIFALFFAILLNPIVNFLSRRRVPHIISIALSLLLGTIVAATLIFFIMLQFSVFQKSYPQLKEKFKETGQDIEDWSARKFNVDADKMSQWIDNTESETIKHLTGSVGATLLTVGNALIVVILIPVYVFLILYYKLLLLEFVRKLFRVDHHKTVVEVLESVKGIIQSYLVGLLIEGTIVAILNSVALLALGVPSAILLGIAGAILNVIPYIGGIAAIALPMIIAFVTKSVLTSVLVLGIYLIIQFIDNHYLIPYIVASKVKLNALIAIAVVLVGDLIWGVPGMFLAIPLTALIKVIFDHIEPLKPWGFLLGDNMPSTIRLPFMKKGK